MSEHSDTESFQNVAIIGMSCRLPGADSLDQFWNNLVNGVETITSLTDEQLLKVGVDRKFIDDPRYVKKASLLIDVDKFDAEFFNFTPREASITDPQQRLLLECVYQALEHAGYSPAEIQKKVALYTGIGMNGYLLNNLLANPQLIESVGAYPLLFGNDKCYAATQIAYKLDFNGPVLAVDTACSTGLVATHHAYRSLLSYESDVAIAGVAKLNVPQTGYFYEQGSINSKDGHCRAFDESSSGTIFGSGAGVVVLKRLEDAIEDGDTIHAVIKGSAINNDGSAKVGFSAPSVKGQQNVISEALMFAEVEAESISYIECHGTGTQLGDPIEFEALQGAFSKHTDKKGFCALGTVKTNMGHLETAAGMAGLIKTILSLKNKKIPPSIHFNKANPEIDFDNSCFYFNDRLQDWKNHHHPLRAGISSFGIGGSNAHVILEQAPSLPKTQRSTLATHILPISAKTEKAFENIRSNLRAFLSNNMDAEIADIAYTLQNGRECFNVRGVVRGRSIEDLLNSLERLKASHIKSLRKKSALDRNSNEKVINFCELSDEALSEAYDKLEEQWLSGETVDWSMIYKVESRRRIPLPNYPFDRKRHWIDPPNHESLIDMSLVGSEPPSSDDAAEKKAGNAAEAGNSALAEIEAIVIKIWQDLLGIYDITVDDNYFHLGGQSLTASRIMTRIEEMTGVELPVQALYEAATAAKLAEKVLETQLELLEGEDLESLSVKG